MLEISKTINVLIFLTIMLYLDASSFFLNPILKINCPRGVNIYNIWMYFKQFFSVLGRKIRFYLFSLLLLNFPSDNGAQLTGHRCEFIAHYSSSKVKVHAYE